MIQRITKTILFLIQLLCGNIFLLSAQNSDCPTALFLCNENTLNVAGGAYSQGSIAEAPGCWFGHTDNGSHWYTFTCTQSGTFTFSCLPMPYADFDFAMYNITGSASGTCNLGNMVSCNYSVPAGNGTTGIGCANGAGCNTTVNLVAGQTYALLINRYTAASTSGFSLSFGGTAQIGIVADFTNTVACLGQSVQFTNTSSTGTGVTYNWDFSDGGTSTATSPYHLYATAGTFDVQLITSNGSCSDTIIHQVTVTPGPTVTVNPNSSVICSGQTVALTASGATTYSWSPNLYLTSSTGANVTASPPGTITYTVTGTTNGCTGTGTTTLTVSPLTTVVSSPSASTICAGDNVTLIAVGANTYSWSPSTGLNISTGNSVIASPTTTTTYILTGTNAAGCAGYDTTIITVNPQPIILINPSALSFCIGGNIQLTASGGVNYSWSPSVGLSATNVSTVTASPSVTSTYSIDATDVNGCSNTTTIVVTVNSLPTVTVNPIASSICSGDNVLLTSSGGSSYIWSPSNSLSSSTGNTVTATPTLNVTYTVVGTSVVGCTDQTTVTVDVLPLPVINILPANPSICIGSSVNLAASGASTYLWSPTAGLNNSTGATVTASPNLTSSYSITGTAANGCSSSSSVTVTVNTLPTVTVNPAAVSICAGNNIQLSAIGANTYSWIPVVSLNNNLISNPIASPATTTTYTVTGSSGVGCTANATALVTVNPLPTVSVSPTSVLFCPGNSVTLNAIGAINYLWSPAIGLSSSTGSSVTASDSATTNYSVTGTDGNGCSAIAYADVVLDPYPVASFDVFPSIGCSPLIVNFQSTSSNGVNAVWNFGDGASGSGNFTQHIYTIGIYDVQLISSNTSGCKDSSSQIAAVTVLQSPTAFFNMDPPAPGNVPYTDNLFNFSNSSIDASSYVWNFGDNSTDTSFNTSHSFTEPGDFYVVLTAISANGCSDTARSPVILIKGEPTPWIPSAFTPNGDEVNDIFKIYGIAIAEVEFRIFDRIGELVFETTDPTIGWDGNFLGKKASTDVYVYYAKIKMRSGDDYILQGDVTLIR